MAPHLERPRTFFPRCAVALLAALTVDSMAISHTEQHSVFPTLRQLPSRGGEWQLRRRTGLPEAPEAANSLFRSDLRNTSTIRRPRTLVTRLQPKVSRTIPPLPNSNFVSFHSSGDQDSSKVSPRSVASRHSSGLAFSGVSNDLALIKSDGLAVGSETGDNVFGSHPDLPNSKRLNSPFVAGFSSPILSSSSNNIINLDSIFPIPSRASFSSHTSPSLRSGRENDRQVSSVGIRENFLSIFGMRPVPNVHTKPLHSKLPSYSDNKHSLSHTLNFPRNSKRETAVSSFKRDRSSRHTRTSFLAPEETNDISDFSFGFRSTTNAPSRFRSSLQATIIEQQSTSSPFKNYVVQNVEVIPSAFHQQSVSRKPDVLYASGNDHSFNPHLRVLSADHNIPSRSLSNTRQHVTGVAYSVRASDAKNYPLLRGNFIGSRTYVG